MAQFPIGMLEWEPAVSGAKQKRISLISATGMGDTTNNSNYPLHRRDAFTSINLSGTVWQVCCYWDNTATPNMVVGVRNTEHGAWTLYTLDGGGSRALVQRLTVDNHNTCEIGIDSAGYLHIAYDMHAQALNYRKSTNPVTSFAGEFGAETSMLGSNELSVAYPTFFRDPLDVLYFAFRDGASSNGDLFIYKYSTGSGTWAGLGGTTAGKVVNGKTSSPIQSPYWARPEFTPDFDGAGTGFMYVAWNWRETPDAQSSHDMTVVRWDGVNTWTKTDGTSQTMPVTLANGDIASATVQQNLTFCSFIAMALDSNKRPHMVVTGQDVSDSNRSKLWHVYWNGSAWTTTAIAGGAGFDFGLNSADMVMDADDTIRMIVVHATGVGNGAGIYAYVSAGSNWASWTLESLSVESTLAVEVGNASLTNCAGNHDPYQWRVNGVYRMMVPITGYWKLTEDDFSTWTGGYMQATADAPSDTVTNPTLRLTIDSSWTQFWAAVASDGKDVRVADSGGQQFPCDLAEWNYAGQFALITFMRYGDVTTGPTIRVYAGKASATAPAATDTFGQYAAYHPDCYGYWPSGGGNDRTQYLNHFTMTGSPSATAATGVMGETTYAYDGSTQYGLTSTKVVNTAMTIMLNAKPSSNTANGCCLSNAKDSTTGDYRCVWTRGADASDPVMASSRIGAGTSNDSTKIGFTINTWCHIAGRFVSSATTDGSRTAYFDGVAGTANTTSIGIPPATRIGIAVLARSALDNKYAGKLANVWVFASDIGDAKVNYNYQQNNQTTFWNTPWSWTAAGGGSIFNPYYYRLLAGGAG